MMLAFQVQTVALLGWCCNEESTGYFCTSTWNDSVNDLILFSLLLCIGLQHTLSFSLNLVSFLSWKSCKTYPGRSAYCEHCQNRRLEHASASDQRADRMCHCCRFCPLQGNWHATIWSIASHWMTDGAVRTMEDCWFCPVSKRKLGFGNKPTEQDCASYTQIHILFTYMWHTYMPTYL